MMTVNGAIIMTLGGTITLLRALLLLLRYTLDFMQGRIISIIFTNSIRRITFICDRLRPFLSLMLSLSNIRSYMQPKQ